MQLTAIFIRKWSTPSDYLPLFFRVTKQSFPDHSLLPWWTVLVFLFLGIHNNGCRAWQALPYNPAHSEYLCYLPDCWRQPAGYLAYLNLSTKSRWWWNRLRTLPYSSVLETAPPVQISKTSWVFSWETNISFPATEDPTWPIACQRTKLVLFAYRGEQWTCSPTPSPSWAEVRISGLPQNYICCNNLRRKVSLQNTMPEHAFFLTAD